ncbi:MAG: M23 family metallopeptidase [Candidatus Latescibacterota bacterium]
MAQKRLTLLFIPHGRSDIREMGISHRAIWLGVMASVCLLGALSFYTVGYYAKVIHEKELGQLRLERTELLACIETMGGNVEGLGKQIGDLIEHGKALRVLANLPEIDEDTRKVGVGGPLYEEENAAMPLSSEAEFLVSRVQGDLDQLLRETELERISLTEIEERFTQDQSLRDHTPSIRPAEGYFSSGFGMRRDPFTGRLLMHKGLDISGRTGTPVHVTADGVVEATGYTRGFGRYVIINHGYGYKTYYGHLSKSLVTAKTNVRRGEKIAEMGSTGRSTGPHLHYEVRHNGRAVDPWNYVFVEE